MFAPFLQAQNDSNPGSYKLSAGVRIAPDFGVTGKYFLNETSAIECIIGSTAKYQGFGIIGLYEIHAQAFKQEGLNWFYGGGAHLNFYNNRLYVKSNDRTNIDNPIGAGIEALIGIEYYIQEIPFTIGVDVKPYLDLTPAPQVYVGGGFTIRYVIK